MTRHHTPTEPSPISQGTDAPLILSVSGMRGVVGQSLDPATATRFAACFAGWVRDTVARPEPTAHPANDPPHVVIGRDSRRSGEMLEMAAVAGLLAAGCRVTRLGIATTPGVSVMVTALGADAGLIVTASHNPAPWNGLKPIVRDGSAPTPEDAAEIIDRFHGERAPHVAADALRPCAHRPDTDRIHAERVAACVDREAIRNAKLTVAVNSIHGAGGRETRALMHALGIRHYYHFHGEPTGRFPHAPEPTAANLADFCAELPDYAVDVAFVQDPDADRLAIIDEQARWIGEEYTLALCAKHRLRAGERAVANLSGSRMIDDVAQQAGAEVVRAPVGEANVAAAMRACGAVIGGEGNGGVMLPEVTLVRNSLVGIALVLEMIATRKQPISAIVDELPRYAIVKDKAQVSERVMARLGDVLGERYPDAEIDHRDGVRLAWADRWAHVRPSNTEPVVRLLAEARDRSDAETLVADVREALASESGEA